MGAGMALSGRNVRRAALLVSAAGVLALAGCGNSPNGNRLAGAFATAAANVAAGQRAPSRVTTPEAEQRAFPTPLLKLTREATGDEALVGAGGRNGDDVTWYSADRRAITLRDGLLAGTSGFGFDLMSADLPAVRAGGGGLRRVHYYLGGDERTRPLRFDCTVSDLGGQSIAVAGRTYATRALRETCAGDGGLSFVNSYWVEPGGTIRRSRQWAGPELGYFGIDKVNG